MFSLSSCTATAYFEKLEKVFVKQQEYTLVELYCFFSRCVSVNIGRHNSIKNRLEKRNPSVYTLGCPCHFIHNTAHAAAKKLGVATGFDVEEIVVDIYYFDRSTKRKREHHELQLLSVCQHVGLVGKLV